jgi:hypothetical protein
LHHSLSLIIANHEKDADLVQCEIKRTEKMDFDTVNIEVSAGLRTLVASVKSSLVKRRVIPGLVTQANQALPFFDSNSQ